MFLCVDTDIERRVCYFSCKNYWLDWMHCNRAGRLVCVSQCVYLCVCWPVSVLFIFRSHRYCMCPEAVQKMRQMDSMEPALLLTAYRLLLFVDLASVSCQHQHVPAWKTISATIAHIFIEKQYTFRLNGFFTAQISFQHNIYCIYICPVYHSQREVLLLKKMASWGL